MMTRVASIPRPTIICRACTPVIAKYNQDGEKRNYPESCQNFGWCVETELDIEMVSVSCPKCTIYLMESDGTTHGMEAAETKAVKLGATLVSNSVPLVQSVNISRAILGNKRIAGSLDLVTQGIKRGEGISEPLRRTGQFPALAAHLLSVGEETGKLDAMFTRMADIYETETRDSIKRFTALFEPLIILIMGVVVGALILSMLIAITSINEVAG